VNRNAARPSPVRNDTDPQNVMFAVTSTESFAIAIENFWTHEKETPWNT
jgi:hypothetical protein